MRKLIIALMLVLCVCVCAMAEAAPTPDSDAWVQVEKDSAIREKPEKDAEIVKKVPKGSELDYMGKSSDGKWYHVKYKGDKGWLDVKDGSLKWSTFY